MKYLQWALIILSGIVTLFSITEGATLHWEISFRGIHNYIKLFEQYSILYAATFVVITVNLGINQLKLTESEIENRRSQDKRNETLKRCDYYLTEFQFAYKNLLQLEGLNGMPYIEWSKMKTTSSKSLQEEYPMFYNKIDHMDRETKNTVLIILYKLDAFAAYFIYGDADFDLGKNLIGYSYCKQIAFLKGFISYFRPSDLNGYYFQNILSLYDKWYENKKNFEEL